MAFLSIWNVILKSKFSEVHKLAVRCFSTPTSNAASDDLSTRIGNLSTFAYQKDVDSLNLKTLILRISQPLNRLSGKLHCLIDSSWTRCIQLQESLDPHPTNGRLLDQSCQAG
jgi:hypothetical protein